MTLSSADLENFLSEVSSDDISKAVRRRTVSLREDLPTVDETLIDNRKIELTSIKSHNVENIDPNITSQLLASRRSIRTDSPFKNMSVTLNAEDKIRQYCKVSKIYDSSYVKETCFR